MAKNNTEKSSRKEAAVTFLQLASSGKVKGAFHLYIGQNFRHHNPFFLGTAEALMAAMEANVAQFPNKVIEIKRVLEEGDLVAVHSHVTLKPDDLGVITFHLFRSEGDQIVELWDVGQPVPEQSLNEYGMF